MLRAALCDIDGTLVNSNVLHAKCWVQAFEHFGYHVGLSEVLRQIGKGGDQLLPHFIAEDHLKALEEPIKKYRKRLFEEKYIDRIEPFPAVRSLLQRMRGAGLRIALASSSDRDHMARLKEIAQITDLVEEETSSADAERSKPNPDIFEAAIDRLGVTSSQCLALGDTPWDIEAALMAGVATVAVTSGGWSRAALNDSGAIAVYADVADLLAKFDSSPFAVASD